MPIDRRQFFQASAALGASLALPAPLLAAQRSKARRIDLTPSAFSVALDPDDARRTAVWGFNEQLPGPTLRFRRGEQGHLAVRNQLLQ